MNLQPLFDLKERLEYAAIAGTGLMQEDFRLRRAVEALAPLAGVNPVFAKIAAASKALLSTPKEERSKRLLDVLSLVDAVVYTQGVSNMTGDMTAIQPGSGIYVDVSYGQLQPLVQALSGTGSGRMSLIQNCYVEHPEYFRDFRVLPHVVKALGDNYTELAEFIEFVLMKQGASIIPLLKEGFDPAGKTEMVRRVHLVARLGGAGENEWFVSILPDSQKIVREALIQALGLCSDNGQLLLDLCRSEKGKLKEAALRSLARMEGEEAAALWEKECGKKPMSAGCLAGVDTPLAAGLTASALKHFLEELAEKCQQYDGAALEKLMKLMAAACGKYALETAELWNWIAENMHRFHQIQPEKKVYNCDLTVAELLQRMMMQSILVNPCPQALTLVRTLAERCREWFLCGAVLADMAEMSAAQLYDTYGPMIVRTGVLRKENAAERNQRVQILRALAMVAWNDSIRAYCVSFIRYDALTGSEIQSIRKMVGLDRRWITLLADPKVKDDGGVYYPAVVNVGRKVDSARGWLLGKLIDQDDPAVCAEIGSWLYQYTLETGRIQESLQLLMNCGWKKWQGILVHCFRKRGEASYPMAMSMIRLLPMTNMEKAAELKELNRLVQSKALKTQYNLWPQDSIVRDIAILEADPNAEL